MFQLFFLLFYFLATFCKSTGAYPKTDRQKTPQSYISPCTRLRKVSQTLRCLLQSKMLVITGVNEQQQQQQQQQPTLSARHSANTVIGYFLSLLKVKVWRLLCLHFTTFLLTRFAEIRQQLVITMVQLSDRRTHRRLTLVILTNWRVTDDPLCLSAFCLSLSVFKEEKRDLFDQKASLSHLSCCKSLCRVYVNDQLTHSVCKSSREVSALSPLLLLLMAR